MQVDKTAKEKIDDYFYGVVELNIPAQMQIKHDMLVKKTMKATKYKLDKLSKRIFG